MGVGVGVGVNDGEVDDEVDVAPDWADGDVVEDEMVQLSVEATLGLSLHRRDLLVGSAACDDAPRGMMERKQAGR